MLLHGKLYLLSLLRASCAEWRSSGGLLVAMNGKTALKRLERLAQRWPQTTFADDLETKLDNMTDDEIALRLDAYARLVDFWIECGEDEVELDAEVESWAVPHAAPHQKHAAKSAARAAQTMKVCVTQRWDVCPGEPCWRS